MFSRAPKSAPKPPPPPEKGPCPHLCTFVPVDLPHPHKATAALHPRKDVFILKVAKIGLRGERRSKLELELVTPKVTNIKIPPYRTDTREAQCEPCECPPCPCCCPRKKKRK